MIERELLRMNAVPVYQNKMFGSAEAARSCPSGDLVLTQNEQSGLVHNAAFNPALIQYDSSYQNEQVHSSAFRAHIDQVIELVGRHFEAMSILEIGCGKGAFLNLLLAAGHEARGIDPAYEGDSPHIVPRAFEPGLGIRANAIIMRHVLEHIPSPVEFLQHVRTANGGVGRIYIEVPCLDWIMQQRAWFDIFYEHVNYFRIDDFARIFGNVIEAGHLFGGQYLYAVAELESLRDPAIVNGISNPVTLPIDFFARLDRCAAAVRSSTACAIWGAAAKGVMFSHHLQLRGVMPSIAIDINPAKQGCFLAGTGLPVLPPSEAIARLGATPDIFVMNSNYLSEIRALGGAGPNYIAVDHT